MVVELQQGRSEHNYARSEMYSVIIHHAVSGCFACRKIICFNLPSFQTHSEHHILCKKVTLGGTIELTTAVPLLLKGWFVIFFVSHTLPHQVYTRHPLSAKRFKVFLSQKRGSCYSLFLLISCSLQSHRDPCSLLLTHTPLSITAFLLCCRPGEILQCREVTSRMQSFSFPPTWTI